MIIETLEFYIEHILKYLNLSVKRLIPTINRNRMVYIYIPMEKMIVT
jgi:hypothetical protein